MTDVIDTSPYSDENEKEYDFKDSNIHRVIRCQRNWDWDNPVTPEHLQILDEYANKPPQQQGEEAFKVVRIHNNYEKVTELLTKLHGLGNTQIISPLVYIWFPAMREKVVKQNSFQCGLHAGIIIKLANELGYETGFCGCGKGDHDAWDAWTASNNLLPAEDYTEPLMILSIGHGKPGEEYHQDQLTDFKHGHFPYKWPGVSEL